MWAQMRWGWSDRLFLLYIIFVIIIIAGVVGKQWQMRWSNLYLFSIDLCLCGKALPKGWTLIKTTHPSKSNVEIKHKWENPIKKNYLTCGLAVMGKWRNLSFTFCAIRSIVWLVRARSIVMKDDNFLPDIPWGILTWSENAKLWKYTKVKVCASVLNGLFVRKWLLMHFL